MGTLFSQPERKSFAVGSRQLESALKELSALAAEHKVALADVIALKVALERERANDIRVANGDVWDEQIAGIGEILRETNERLERMAQAIAEGTQAIGERLEALADNQ